MNEQLKVYVNNWYPNSIRKVLNFKQGYESLKIFGISTISDRTWQCLINFCLEPVHEAFFHPNNIGFRSGRLIYEVQKRIFFNLNSNSFGKSKRLLKLNLIEVFNSFDINILVSRLLAPKGIKLGVFRCAAYFINNKIIFWY